MGKAIIYLSSVVPLEGAEKNSGISIAGNKMEYNILRGIGENLPNNVELYSISVLPIAPWPRDKSLLYKPSTICIDCKYEVLNVGFLNIPYLKQFIQQKNVKKAIKQIIKRNSIDELIIVIFNCFPQVGLPAIKIKKDCKCKVVSILADLPIDVVKRNVIGKFFRKVFDTMTINIMNQCDGLVVLNETVIRDYNLSCDYIVCEGGCENMIQAPNPYSCKIKKYVFTGTLNEYNGLIELIEAFKLLKDKPLELDVYGDGVLKERIQGISNTFDNIKYLGFKPNDEVLEIQREAFALINPRPTNDSISRVTFPSKLFEYLASGRPVISTRFVGVPPEYEKYVYFIKDNKPETIVEMINKVSSIPEEELLFRGKEAVDFLVHEKSWQYQGKRISSFINRFWK